jgi:hypothetical protein
MALFALMAALLQTPPAAKPAEKTGVTCRVTLSADMSLQDRWFHSPGEVGINLQEATSVVRQQTIAAYVFFTHWTTRNDGQVDVDYDLRIKKPSGALYRSEELLRGHMGAVGEDEHILLCDQVLDLAFTPDDPFGEYVVIVTLRDNAGRKISTIEKPIKLVDYADGAPLEDAKSFDRWMRGYYMAPEPLRAIPTLCALGHAGYWKDAQLPSASTAFFSEVFNANTWLFPHLFERFDVQEPETKRLILWMLARSSFDAKPFVAGLHGADKDTWQSFSAEQRRDPLLEPITKTAHIDELWGIFYATGKSAVVQRLSEALVPERTEAIGDVPEREALKTAVATSLKARERDMILVRGYCDWILSNDMTSDGVRDALKKALGR